VSEAAQEQASAPVFSPVVAIAMAAIGALSLLFYVVFAAYAPDVSGDSDPRANVISRSAVGFAGLAAFLREQGIPVLISRGLSEDQLDEASLIIITPDLENSAAEIGGISSEAPKLVILPKWRIGLDPLHAGWVRNAGLLSDDIIVKRMFDSEGKSATLQRGSGAQPVRLHNGLDNSNSTTGPITSLQTISGSNWTGFVTDAANHLIVARMMDGDYYVLSDPDLMNTHGLKDLATARTAAAIITSLRDNDGPVIFDVTLNGYRRSPNLLRLLFEPPLLAATLCTLLAALLMGIHAAVRFGAPIAAARAFAPGKQALADNSAALIAMTHRAHRIVPRYAAAIRRRVARAVGAPADARDDVLNECLEKQRPSHAQAQPLAEIIAEAGKAQNEADAVRVARKLHRWRREMLHER